MFDRLLRLAGASIHLRNVRLQNVNVGIDRQRALDQLHGESGLAGSMRNDGQLMQRVHVVRALLQDLSQNPFGLYQSPRRRVRGRDLHRIAQADLLPRR